MVPPRGRCGLGRLGCCTPAVLSLLVFSFCTTICAKHTRMRPGQALRAAVPGGGTTGATAHLPPPSRPQDKQLMEVLADAGNVVTLTIIPAVIYEHMVKR